MTNHLATVGRKSSLLKGRNPGLNQAQGEAAKLTANK